MGAVRWFNSKPKFVGLACAGGFLTAATLVPTASAQTQSDWAKDGAPLIAKYCMPCHSTDVAIGGAALDKALTMEDIQAASAMWEKAAAYIRTEHMPPPTSKQPTQAERQKMLAALEAALTGNCEIKDPGLVTIRRLNKFEYANTVRDLLQVDLDPTIDFPSDDVGNGFDNMGEVLSISTLLMEGYISAAEQLAEAAIVVPDYSERRYDVSEMALEGGVRATEDAFFSSRGEAAVMHEFPREGSYTLKISAWGQQAGPEVCRAQILINNMPVQTVDVPGTRAKPTTVEIPLELNRKDRRKISVVFINDYYNPNDPNPQNRDRNLALISVEVKGPFGRASALPLSHRSIIFVTPPEGQERATAKTIIERFASRAYRRPAEAGEVERLLKLYDLTRADGLTFEHGIRMMVTAVLASPHFLFRVELDNGVHGDEPTPVSAYALASRLSYFLWGTMPDEPLMRTAQTGELLKPSVLEAQVDRMLKSPKASALADSFGMQWLQLARLETRSPDPELFPGFDDQLKRDLVTETKMFFMEVLTEDHPVTDFIDGQYTFLNANLARHYGIGGVTGDRFRKVSLEGSPRGGVLTHGSILTVTSNPTRTSPVKRGKWVLEQILGTPPPPPPPGADVLADEVETASGLTFREKMDRHRTDPNCAACHSKMDPLGFGLENFDAVGKWRDVDLGRPVDASGELPGGIKFSGPQELQKILLNDKDKFVRSLSREMLAYALGRGLAASDACHVDEITAQVEKADYKFSALVKAIVQSEAFRMKRPESKP